MNPAELYLRDVTRRHFFGRCAVGLGAVALNSLLQRDALGASADRPGTLNPMAPHAPQFPGRAKRVIFL